MTAPWRVLAFLVVLSGLSIASPASALDPSRRVDPLKLTECSLTAFWQTPLFVFVLILALAAVLWVFYNFRLQAMGRRIKLRLEDRMAERERIAREIHDTLLQGFQGLTMRFQSVAEQIPPTEPTRLLLDRALDRAEEVLIEGRDRVWDLRAGEGQGDLAFLIEAAAYRLRADPDVAILMVVEGDCTAIHPVVCDEVLAIANEALSNAFKHSRADAIELGLACDRRTLRLRIADNGVGIHQGILETAACPGHDGLVGMRERARKIKAKISIRNGAKGADIQLLVPRRTAYNKAEPRRSLLPHPHGANA